MRSQHFLPIKSTTELRNTDTAGKVLIPCRIRIRHGYAWDTAGIRIHGVSAYPCNSDAGNSRTDTYPTATSRPRAPLGPPTLLRSAACCSAPPMAACHPCRSSRLRRSARGRPRRAERRRVGSGGGGARKPPTVALRPPRTERELRRCFVPPRHVSCADSESRSREERK